MTFSAHFLIIERCNSMTKHNATSTFTTFSHALALTSAINFTIYYPLCIAQRSKERATLNFSLYSQLIKQTNKQSNWILTNVQKQSIIRNSVPSFSCTWAVCNIQMQIMCLITHLHIRQDWKVCGPEYDVQQGSMAKYDKVTRTPIR